MTKTRTIYQRAYEWDCKGYGGTVHHGELILKGKYLEKFGFSPGDLVRVTFQRGLIQIYPVTNDIDFMTA